MPPQQQERSFTIETDDSDEAVGKVGADVFLLTLPLGFSNPEAFGTVLAFLFLGGLFLALITAGLVFSGILDKIR